MCLRGALSSITYNLLCSMTTFRLSEKNVLTIWPHPCGRWCVSGQNLCLHGALCSIPLIWYVIWLISVKDLFNLLTPGIDGVCKDRICAYMVLFAPFRLIWYTTWLLSEKNVLTFDPTPGVEDVCKDRLCACMLLHSSFPLIWCVTWPWSEKVEFWPFDHTPVGRGKGGVYEQNDC